MAPRPLSPSPLFLLLLSAHFAPLSSVLPFDKSRRCQPAENWPLNGRPLVNDYRGRVLLLVFMPSERDKQCERELNRLDTLSQHFSDVRVLAVASRGERTSEVRAFAWQFPRIRFEQETAEAPVWRWFNASHLDKAIFDRCSRLTGWVPSGADFAITLSVLQTTLSSSPCGHCDFDSGQKRIHWPSFHPPVSQQQKKNQQKDVFVNIDGFFLGPSSSLRQWNSPTAHGEYYPQQQQRAEKRRLHWTVDTEQQQSMANNTNREQKKKQRQRDRENGKEERDRPAIASSTRQKQLLVPMPYRYQHQQHHQQYLYGQQLGGHLQQSQRGQQTERPTNWARQQLQQGHHDQQQQQPPRGVTTVSDEAPRRRGAERGDERVPSSSHDARHPNGRTDGRLPGRGNVAAGHLSSQREQQAVGQRRWTPQQTDAVPTTTATGTGHSEPAPLYPEGSEDAVGDDYYGDEYAAEWTTTEAPEAAKQIPKPTRPATPTPSATQAADKSFGFELPCTGFSDESCFQQQTQLRPNEVHRCCRGRILFTDQCAIGKCSNATVQLCCIQRFLQAKLTCCSDERQANTEVGDHFSRCCFEHFVDGEDPCCPRAYAAEQWRSVHELCLPNVEMDLTGVKVPSPLVGTTLITDFDFSKTDRWRFECRYGSHVQQYSFFEASASLEDDQQQDEEDD